MHTRSARRPRTAARPALAAAFATVFAAVLALSACGSTPGNEPAPGSTASTAAGGTHSGTLRVVATTTQLADFAREIGGEDIALTSLLPAGASAHHFDPSPKELLALSRADILIVNGAGLEGFIESAVEASGFSGTLVTAADGIDLAEAQTITAEAEHEAEHDGTAEDHDAAADHHDHDHGDINPHLWTSPRYARAMSAEIARGLAAADPTHAADYTSRLAAYDARLASLDEWISGEFSRVPAAERVLVSGHDSLRYYLHDYDIAFVGAIIPSFEDNAEPSAAQIDTLVARIIDRGVKAVFVESSMSPKLARTIAREAGITVVDAENLYADSLGAAGSGAETFIDATVHNTRLILTAWGVTPTTHTTESETTE